MRPSGPLPPRVYWLRRAVLVFSVLLVAGVLWWLLSGLGSVPETTGPPRQQTSPVGTSAPPTHDTRKLTTRAGDGRHPAKHHRKRPQPGKRHQGSHQPRKPEPLPAPTGPCSPADVAMTVKAGDTTTGHATMVTLSLTSSALPACNLAITPETMVLRITSGADVVWSSDDCPDSLPSRQVVVRTDPTPATTYQFSWDGRRSVQGCTAPGSVAKAGGYWAEVALVGADSHRGYFDVSQ